jgi:DNA primase
LDHIDCEEIKRAHPIEEIVAGYGIALRRTGRNLVGRCPFHPDGGRPNLYVYPGSDSFYCYRCAAGGDVIRFVERIEGVGFRGAVERLLGGSRSSNPRPVSTPARPWRRVTASPAPLGPAERACLAAAVELYHNRLLTDPEALAYVQGRGIDRATCERHRVGYAAGDELASYLRWRRLPVPAAMQAGLIGRDGRELMAGRVVVPEIRGGQPIWLVGRSIHADDSGPKYLGLPSRKPLLGWEAAQGARSVYLVEGVFDWLTLRGWGLPALALVGTRVRSGALRVLARFQRVYLALDNDAAGREATAVFQQALGERGVAVQLPGVKDVAELAPLPGGRDRLLDAVRCSELSPAA